MKVVLYDTSLRDGTQGEDMQLAVADKLAIAADARAKGRTAEDAARLVGWSRATLYRHQQALKGRENI